ncbi:MAG: MFS transporter, partial [Rhodospirillales bacterium]|nr:MFS transporter [Rhodospirillales bacterium]
GITALHLHFDLALAEAGAAVSAYLFAAPVGVMLSGWMSDRSSRHHSFVVVCFGVVAAVALAIAIATPTLAVVVGLFAVAGFFIGAVNPARDMLIRSMVTVAETGKAFGFVTIGLSAGAGVAALLYGWILDHSDPIAIFWAIGVMALVTIAVVTATARVQSRVLAARAAG